MGKRFTRAVVLATKATDKRQEIGGATAEALYLIVQPTTGTKSWMMKFRRPSGVIGKVHLGPFDDSNQEQNQVPNIGQPMTVAAARAVAAEINRQRARGVDVVGERKAEQQRQEEGRRDALTFPSAARAFIDDHRAPGKGRKPKRWLAIARAAGRTEGRPLPY